MFLEARNGDNGSGFFSGAFITLDFTKERTTSSKTLKKQLRLALKQRKIDLRFNNVISTKVEPMINLFSNFLIFHWPLYKIIFPFRSFKTTINDYDRKATDR